MINPSKFEHIYKQLLYVTCVKYHDSNPAFDTGGWRDQEYYKYEVWDKARKALKLDLWESHKEDSKFIIDRAIDAIDACGNLLSTDHSQFAQEAYISTYNKVIVTLLENQQKTAEALYGIFFEEDEARYFDMLASILRKIYDGFSYVAYFFFLKNRDNFAPVRRKANTIQLKKLGVSPACMDPCRWKNYMVYLDVIKEIKINLERLGVKATLLDAQSFLWMLWMVDIDTPEYVDNAGIL